MIPTDTVVDREIVAFDQDRVSGNSHNTDDVTPFALANVG